MIKPGSKQWKLFMAKLYGIGAAIVIVGALFKIMHWPGAGPMLVVGLSTEAVIFLFSAFEPPHEDPDWSLVYPELAGMHGDDDGHDKHTEEPESVTEALDKMLEDAKIEPQLIQSLGDGLRSLSDQTSKLNNLTDASVATNDYVSNVKSASTNMRELSSNYEKASAALVSITESNSIGQSYGDQLNKMARNLSELNSVYELQLQGTSEHLKATNKFYEGIEDLMKNLNDSVQDTKKYKEEISELSKNLTALNTIYGNMLNAMNFNR